MSWKVAVSGVVHIIGVSEIEGIVVLVEFIGLDGFIVFDTITVQVIIPCHKPASEVV